MTLEVTVLYHIDSQEQEIFAEVREGGKAELRHPAGKKKEKEKSRTFLVWGTTTSRWGVSLSDPTGGDLSFLLPTLTARPPFERTDP